MPRAFVVGFTPEEGVEFATGAELPPLNEISVEFCYRDIERTYTATMAPIRRLIFPSSKISSTCNSETSVLNHLHNPSMPRGPRRMIFVMSSTVLSYPMAPLSARSAISHGS